jgi:hypothetical protein
LKAEVCVTHYQKIAVVILRSVGCYLLVYSVSGVFSGVAHAVLLESKETSLIPFMTNLLSCLTYFIAGAILYVLSRPLAYLIAGRLKAD